MLRVRGACRDESSAVCDTTPGRARVVLVDVFGTVRGLALFQGSAR